MFRIVGTMEYFSGGGTLDSCSGSIQISGAIGGSSATIGGSNGNSIVISSVIMKVVTWDLLKVLMECLIGLYIVDPSRVVVHP